MIRPALRGSLPAWSARKGFRKFGRSLVGQAVASGLAARAVERQGLGDHDRRLRPVRQGDRVAVVSKVCRARSGTRCPRKSRLEASLSVQATVEYAGIFADEAERAKVLDHPLLSALFREGVGEEPAVIGSSVRSRSRGRGSASGRGPRRSWPGVEDVRLPVPEDRVMRHPVEAAVGGLKPRRGCGRLPWPPGAGPWWVAAWVELRAASVSILVCKPEEGPGILSVSIRIADERASVDHVLGQVEAHVDGHGRLPTSRPPRRRWGPGRRRCGRWHAVAPARGSPRRTARGSAR